MGSDRLRMTSFLQHLFAASGISCGEVRILESQEAVVWTMLCVSVCVCLFVCVYDGGNSVGKGRGVVFTVSNKRRYLRRDAHRTPC